MTKIKENESSSPTQEVSCSKHITDSSYQLKYQPKIILSGNDRCFTIRVYYGDSNKELSRLLFDKVQWLSNEPDRVRVTDLITSEKSKGHGTFIVNHFIQYCHSHYSPSTIIYGDVHHQEHSNSQAEFYRNRRNRFWGKFGFGITPNSPIFDKMEAKIEDLYCA